MQEAYELLDRIALELVLSRAVEPLKLQPTIERLKQQVEDELACAFADQLLEFTAGFGAIDDPEVQAAGAIQLGEVVDLLRRHLYELERLPATDPSVAIGEPAGGASPGEAGASAHGDPATSAAPRPGDAAGASPPPAAPAAADVPAPAAASPVAAPGWLAPAAAAQVAPAPVAASVPRPRADPDTFADTLLTYDSTQDLSILGSFFAEAEENLQGAEQSLLQLEGDPTDRGALNAAFRALHSIKGISGYLRLTMVRKLAHGAEGLLDRYRRHEKELNPGDQDLLLRTVDGLRLLIGLVQQHTAAPETPLPAVPAVAADILRALDEAGGFAKNPTAWPESAKGSGGASSLGTPGTATPGTGTPGTGTPGTAAPGTATPGAATPGSTATMTAPSSGVTLGTPTHGPATPGPVPSGSPVPSIGSGPSTAPVAHDTAPPAPPFPAASPPPASSGGAARSVPAPGTTTSPAASASHPAAHGESNLERSAGMVRVSVAKLDMLIDAIGELIVIQAQVTHDPDLRRITSRKLSENLSRLTKTSRLLQTLSLSLRMHPIKELFLRLTRVARDIARQQNKALEISITGEETELDKNVIDALTDPLTHLIRNAVDHGVEAGPARAAAGKPRTAKLSLSARHQEGSIGIEVADDGGTLSPAKVLARARNLGMVPPEAALSDPEAIDLIFEPGFSTALEVSEISGRGVGLDVVRKNVEQLGGQVRVSVRPGVSTRFHLELPLTLAIVDGLLVRVGPERYLLPMDAIVHSLRPSPEEIRPVHGDALMLVQRGAHIPVLRLHRFVKVVPDATDPCRGILVLLEHSGRKCAMLVDELLGQQQVVIKSLGDHLQGIAGIAGGAILGDGKVCLILDVGSLLAATSPGAGTAAARYTEGIA